MTKPALENLPPPPVKAIGQSRASFPPPIQQVGQQIIIGRRGGGFDPQAGVYDVGFDQFRQVGSVDGRAGWG